MRKQRRRGPTLITEEVVNEEKTRNTAEHFLEANRIVGEILGELIPKVLDVTISSRLQVIEDILDGANERYTG